MMQVMRYHDGSQMHGAVLVGTAGHKFVPVLIMDAAGIRIRKLPKAEMRYMHETGYPVKRAVNKFKKAGKLYGITKTARRFLQL